MKMHASRRVIPEPVQAQVQEEFDSDDFFTNDEIAVNALDQDEEIGAGYEFARSESSFKESALKLLRLR